MSKIPILLLFKRALIEIPFVFFAILMPFFGEGEKFSIFGLMVYRDGLLAGTSIVVKGTLGVLAAVILSTTTTAREILRGLEKLKLPMIMVQIASFMLRYINVISDEMERMKVARESRGFIATGIKHWKVLATAAAALFIRSYERGERVHLAMLSRGFDGALPSLESHSVTGRDWLVEMSNVPSLQITELAFAYPDGNQALYGVNLTIQKGERVALLGPNGAGKTTLVMHMNGIHPTMQGEVRISGELVDSKNKESLKAIRSKVGIVFQDPDDQLFMPTVGEDVAFGPYNMGLRGEALDKVVQEALTQVGMLEFIDRPPHHLSFGQRRRVAVATVLAMKPEILVLDEPSSNLDPASRRELADILRSLDITIVMVTHDLPYAFELCERSVILSGGIIVADDKTGQILNDEKLLKSHRLELPVGFSFK
jgi:cobalt ECF transporter T component CbiQ